jgi:hypothetical protein
LPAFALARESKVCCLTAYFFAKNIYRYYKLQELGKVRIGTMLETAKGFVPMCFDKVNGFGCLPGQEADLVHTHFGISLIGSERDKDKVESFVHRCRKGGGYALLPKWKPSAYGTRIGLQVLDTLRLPIPETMEITKFIDGLQDPDNGRIWRLLYEFSIGSDMSGEGGTKRTGGRMGKATVPAVPLPEPAVSRWRAPARNAKALRDIGFGPIKGRKVPRFEAEDRYA